MASSAAAAAVTASAAALGAPTPICALPCVGWTAAVPVEHAVPAVHAAPVAAAPVAAAKTRGIAPHVRGILSAATASIAAAAAAAYSNITVKQWQVTLLKATICFMLLRPYNTMTQAYAFSLLVSECTKRYSLLR